MANSFAFVTLLIKETESKSCVSFKLDMIGQWEGIENFIVTYEFTTKFATLGAASRISHALLKDGNSQSRPQPEAVLPPVSYRQLRRRRQRKILLLKAPIALVEGPDGKVFSSEVMT